MYTLRGYLTNCPHLFNFFFSRRGKEGYVVVIFSTQVFFVFLLFLGMVMYANEVETIKTKITRDRKLTTAGICPYPGYRRIFSRACGRTLRRARYAVQPRRIFKYSSPQSPPARCSLHAILTQMIKFEHRP